MNIKIFIVTMIMSRILPIQIKDTSMKPLVGFTRDVMPGTRLKGAFGKYVHLEHQQSLVDINTTILENMFTKLYSSCFHDGTSYTNFFAKGGVKSYASAYMFIALDKKQADFFTCYTTDFHSIAIFVQRLTR